MACLQILNGGKTWKPFLQNWDLTTVEVEKVIDYTIEYILGPVDNRLQEFRIIFIGADVKNM